MANNFIHKKILIAPLDWGLGHVTRCIPIISHLQERGYTILFAGSDAQIKVIKREFPGLETVVLRGYNISYTRSKRWFAVKIMAQVPKIMLSIFYEHRKLKSYIKSYDPCLVISDNRFGMYHSTVPCIFITHQLNIIAPNPALEKIIQKINYRFIKRFNQCWIPDYEGDLNIAGRLSHPKLMPGTQLKYLGPLSRFAFTKTESYIYKFLFLISGPEPQRSLFEKKVLSAVAQLKDTVLIVRGKPLDSDNIPVPGHCKILNHLETQELQKMLVASEYIIGRSGYSTVMEILGMQKKSLLIPTPGQTEQEYLASHLFGQKWCYSCSQDDDLAEHIGRLTEFEFSVPHFDETPLGNIIDSALKELPESARPGK